MSNLEQRVFKLEGKDGRLTDQSQLLPIVLPENATDSEIERLQRNGRKVFRSDDSALIEEFI